MTHKICMDLWGYDIVELLICIYPYGRFMTNFVNLHWNFPLTPSKQFCHYWIISDAAPTSKGHLWGTDCLGQCGAQDHETSRQPAQMSALHGLYSGGNWRNGMYHVLKWIFTSFVSHVEHIFQILLRCYTYLTVLKCYCHFKPWTALLHSL